MTGFGNASLAVVVSAAVVLLGCTARDAADGDVESVEGSLGHESYVDTAVERPVATVAGAADNGGMADDADIAERGFGLWEWTTHADYTLYDPVNPRFVARNERQPISVLMWWVGGGRDEPETADPDTGAREEYDRDGRLLFSGKTLRDSGYSYTRFVYDRLGRLVREEPSLAPNSSSIDVGTLLQNEIVNVTYLTRLGWDVEREARSVAGEIVWTDRERQVQGGWEYSIEYPLVKVGTLALGMGGGHLSSVSWTSRIGTIALRISRGDSGEVTEIVETGMDGETPRSTTNYEYDSIGRLVAAAVWSNQTDSLVSTYEFSDHDIRGNWLRCVQESGAERRSVILRRIEYWE